MMNEEGKEGEGGAGAAPPRAPVADIGPAGGLAHLAARARAAGPAGPGAGAVAHAAMNIADRETRLLTLFPLYRVDILKDSIETSVNTDNGRANVLRIVNGIFTPAYIRQNLINPIDDRTIQRYTHRLSSLHNRAEWKRNQLTIVNDDLQNPIFETPTEYPICLLNYYLDRDQDRGFEVPLLYEGKVVDRFDSSNVRFYIHDAGPHPDSIASGLTQVLTPASFMDPASRNNEGDRSAMSIGLNEDDFKAMGLFHVFDRLTIEPRDPDGYVARLYKNDIMLLEFHFTNNVNMLAPVGGGNHNQYIKGNPTKNRYINSHGPDNDVASTYILLKLMGDLLQVYYAKKLLMLRWNDINRDSICVFTNDNNCAEISKIFGIPCVKQLYGDAVPGNVKALFLFFNYSVGAESLTNTMRMNIYACRKVNLFNNGIVTRINGALATNTLYISGTAISPIPPNVRLYMTKINEVLGVITDGINRLIADPHADTIRIAGVPLPRLNIDINNFKTIIDKYIGRDIVSIKTVGGVIRYNALETIKIFPLLPDFVIFNNDIDTLKGDDRNIRFSYFVSGANAELAHLARQEVANQRRLRAQRRAEENINVPIEDDTEDDISYLLHISTLNSGVGVFRYLGNIVNTINSHTFSDITTRWVISISSIGILTNIMSFIREILPIRGVGEGAPVLEIGPGAGAGAGAAINLEGGRRSHGGGVDNSIKKHSSNIGQYNSYYEALHDPNINLVDLVTSVIDRCIYVSLLRTVHTLTTDDILSFIHPYFMIRGAFSISYTFYLILIEVMAHDNFNGVIPLEIYDIIYEFAHNNILKNIKNKDYKYIHDIMSWWNLNGGVITGRKHMRKLDKPNGEFIASLLKSATDDVMDDSYTDVSVIKLESRNLNKKGQRSKNLLKIKNTTTRLSTNRRSNHAIVAYGRGTRKKRVNTLKRKLRKFRDTGRI